MVVGEEQKRRRINQKKRKPEENPHSNMVAVRDLDEQQISPKESGKKMKKVRSPLSNMAAHPDLDEQQISPKDSRKKMKKKKYSEGEESRAGENKLTQESNSLPSCIDKLREELSCPICFEIFVYPASTWCGHSFCSSCLDEALIKYGNNCPYCRQVISFSLSYNVNTAILNTIDLLFPQEVEARMEVFIKEYCATYNGKHIRFEQEEE